MIQDWVQLLIKKNAVCAIFLVFFEKGFYILSIFFLFFFCFLETNVSFESFLQNSCKLSNFVWLGLNYMVWVSIRYFKIE